MAHTAKAYKKFLLQRSVLDTLRLYLDISEEFLDNMQHHSLLSDDEIYVVRGLRWPSNRNELLQMLVRKPWNKSSFTQFCGILRQTQGAKLTDMFVHKADDFVHEQSAQHEQHITYNDRYSNLLDDKLVGLSMQAKNTVRTLLGEKDDELKALKAENEELRNHIKNLTAENTELKHQLHVLDKAVTNTLAVIHLDGNHESIESGMRELQDRLMSQDTQITDLETENEELKVTLSDVKSKLSMMTSDSIELRQLNASLQETLTSHQETSATDVESLKAALKEEKAKSASIKKKADATEAMYRSNIQMLQQEMGKISEQMLKTARELDSTNKERDKARGELAAVNERTRKLLFSLDLTKETGDSTLSLDHARNMLYVRRRRGSVAPLGGATNQYQNGSTTTRSEPESSTVSSIAPSTKTSTKTLSRRGSYGVSRSLKNGESGTTPRRASMGKSYRYGKQQQQQQQQQKQQPHNSVPESPRSIATSSETKSSTAGSTSDSKGGATGRGPMTDERPLAEQTVHEENEGLTSPRPTNSNNNNNNHHQQQALKCDVCCKQFQEVSNFEGACLYHPDGATKLNVGTELEVWSCCRSQDTYKGCQKARHMSLQVQAA